MNGLLIFCVWKISSEKAELFCFLKRKNWLLWRISIVIYSVSSDVFDSMLTTCVCVIKRGHMLDLLDLCPASGRDLEHCCCLVSRQPHTHDKLFPRWACTISLCLRQASQALAAFFLDPHNILLHFASFVWESTGVSRHKFKCNLFWKKCQTYKHLTGMKRCTDVQFQLLYRPGNLISWEFVTILRGAL